MEKEKPRNIPPMSWFAIDDLFEGNSTESKEIWEKSFPLVSDVIAEMERKKHRLDEEGIVSFNQFIEELKPYIGKRLVVEVPDGFTFKWTLGK